MKVFSNLQRRRFRLLMFASLSVCMLVAQQNTPTNPKAWESLITSSDYMVSDTFGLQTFSSSEKDNWQYLMKGGAFLADPQDYGLMNASAGKVLIIPAGGEAVFETIEIAGYENVIIRSPYACYKVMPGEILNVRAGHAPDPDKVLDWLTPVQSNTSHFQQKKQNALYMSPHVHISGGYNSLTMKTGKATGGSNKGFYAFDSVYIYGRIPVYSLFKGEGKWEDASLWSHNPAMRNRSALINGNISVNKDAYVNSAYLSSGSIMIEEGARLDVNELYLLDGHALYSSGELCVNKRLSVYLSLPEKDKWYFLSFPFDVYTEGIDSRIKLRDETETGAGAYFYMMSYNGEKRAQSGQLSGNWEAVPASAYGGTRPVFEKNKGYLFALDANAPSDTLCFYVNGGDIPSGFARTGSIEINIPETSGKSPGHYGWILCGNPMPAPLSLPRIKENKDIDGYVYIYNGTGYDAHKITDSYTIPPYGAFFVKATRSTVLEIESEDTVSGYAMLPPAPLKVLPGEPSVFDTPADVGCAAIHISFENEQLHIEGATGGSVLSVYDMNGSRHFICSLSGNNASIPLSLPTGIYIVSVKGTVCHRQLIVVR